MPATPSKPKAAVWMSLSLVSLIGMSVAGRETTRELDVFQVMEMRSVLAFVMLLPLVLAAGGFGAMHTERIGQHIGRNVAHYIGQFAWLYALTLIPLAELISIEFTTPIWTALLAAAFLGERLGIRKIAAIALGLLGVVVIVRPGLASVDPGHLVVLGSAVMFGISFTMVKSLTRTESATAIIFWMLIIQSVIGLVPALEVWRWPAAAVWPWIFAIAFTGTFSHYAMARALAHADATVVMPMDFLRLPLTVLVGWLLYSERIDLFTAGGAVLILLGNLVNLQRRGSDAASVA